MDKVPELIGSYKIVSKIGAGGMGAVFRAVHQTLGRKAALKLLPFEFTQSSEYVARFLREARAVAVLNHNNVVTVYDAGEQNGQYYIAMELVEGAPLSALNKKLGPTPEMEALNYLSQAARGLAAAHKEGLIHRDIKPENMLLSRDGVLKIVDFGLVLETSRDSHLTRTGTFLGTPTFMSPEQCDGDTADGRSDLYSLGASFFAVLTGQPPFTAPTALGILYKHKFEEPPNMKELTPDLSDKTIAIILKLLHKKKEDRYSDCEELLADIKDAKKDAKPTPDDWDLDSIMDGLAKKEEIPTLISSLPSGHQSAADTPTLSPVSGAAIGQTPTLGPAGQGSAPTLLTPGQHPSQAHVSSGMGPTLITPPTGPIGGQATPTGVNRILDSRSKIFAGSIIGVAAAVALIIGIAIYFTYSGRQEEKLNASLKIAKAYLSEGMYRKAGAEVIAALVSFPDNQELKELKKRIEDDEDQAATAKLAASKKEGARESKFNSIFDKATQLYENNDLPGALKKFKEAAEKEDVGGTRAKSQIKRIHFELSMASGETHWSAKEYELAATAFEKAASFNQGIAASERLRETKVKIGEIKIAKFLKEKNYADLVKVANDLNLEGLLDIQEVRRFENLKKLKEWQGRALKEKDFRLASGLFNKAAGFSPPNSELQTELLKKSIDVLFNGLLAKAKDAQKDTTSSEEIRLIDEQSILEEALTVKKDPASTQRLKDIEARIQILSAQSKKQGRTKSYVRTASTFIQKGQWEDALKHLKLAKASDPKNPEIQNLFAKASAHNLESKATVLAQAKQYLNAKNLFEEALTFSKQLPERAKSINTKLTQLTQTISQIEKLQKTADELYKRTDITSLKTARDKFNQLAELDPAQEAYSQRMTSLLDDKITFLESMRDGSALLIKGDWSKAEDLFKTAISRKNSEDARNGLDAARNGNQASEEMMLGKSNLKSSHWHTAQENFQSALELLPAVAVQARASAQKDLNAVEVILGKISTLEESARSNVNNGLWPQAKSNYSELIRLNRTMATSYKTAMKNVDALASRQADAKKTAPNSIFSAIRNRVKSGDYTTAYSAFKNASQEYPLDKTLPTLREPLRALASAEKVIADAQRTLRGTIDYYRVKYGSATIKRDVTSVISQMNSLLNDAQKSFVKGSYSNVTKLAARAERTAQERAKAAASKALDTSIKATPKRRPRETDNGGESGSSGEDIPGE